MIVSKVEIAKHQLESAIRAFEANDKLVAITLAGASEEILGVLCKKAGKNKAIELIFSESLSTNQNLTLGQLVKSLNNSRNNLKHLNEDDIDPVEILEIDAQLMLWRAMFNWMKLGHPSSAIIKDFQKWLFENPLSMD